MSVLGIIGGIAAAGTSIYNAVSQKKANKENIYQIEKGRDHQEYLMDKMNLYNSPVQQMQRLASAGLNPNLIYDNQGIMPAANVGIQGGANIAPPQLGDLYSAFIQQKSLDIQQQLADAEVIKKDAETKNILESTKQTSVSIDMIKNQTKLINKEIARYDEVKDIYILNEQMRLSLMDQDFKYRDQVNQLLVVNQMLQNEQIRNNIDNDKMRLALQELLNGAQISEINSRVALNYQEYGFLKEYNKVRLNLEKMGLTLGQQQFKLNAFGINRAREDNSGYNKFLRYAGSTLNVIGQVFGLAKPISLTIGSAVDKK